MKNYKAKLIGPARLITFVILPALLLLAASGCFSANPKYTPPVAGQPNTNTEPPYVVNPAVNRWSNNVAGAAEMAAPANPYAGLTNWAIKLGFGIVGAISAGIATSKNKNAVIATIADGVVKSGVGQAVVDHASTTPHFSAVADAINESTGANQDSTGKPKAT